MWEVRLLKSKIGDKEALLDNPDYLNQHTDSNSTGMIELTQSHDPLIRDLRDWNARDPIFLKDLESGTLHYYFSPLHETTSRFNEGKNPPIVSVIRYLTKAFQYELKIPPEDEKKIKQVIDSFDPKQVTGSYLPGWIEKNGKKLIQNAVNIEYAWNELERVGLRKKLIAIQVNPGVHDSLAHWMNKEPLRSKPVGQGAGKTARELGVDIVAHETNNFLAYESITRAHTGDANVLISRQGETNENAAFGDGFYTAIGKKGARGTGLTIRFKVDPEARLGEDFFLAENQPVAEGSFLIFKNKRALQVIPESLNIGPLEYFEMLAGAQSIDVSDRGILEKLKRRIGSRVTTLNDEQRGKLIDLLESAYEKNPPDMRFISELRNVLPEIFKKINPRIIDSFERRAIDQVKAASTHRELPRELDLVQNRASEMIDALTQLSLRQAQFRTPGVPYKSFEGALANLISNYLDHLDASIQKSMFEKAIRLQIENPNVDLGAIQAISRKSPSMLYPYLRAPDSPFLKTVVAQISYDHKGSDPEFRSLVDSLLKSPDPEKRIVAIEALTNFNHVSDEEKRLVVQEVSSPDAITSGSALNFCNRFKLEVPAELQKTLSKHFLEKGPSLISAYQILARATWTPETFSNILKYVVKAEDAGRMPDIAASELLAEQAKGNPKFEEALISAAEKNPLAPLAIGRISKLKCQSERCNRLYAYYLDHISETRGLALANIGYLMPSRLDPKILKALQKWVFDPELSGHPIDRNIRNSAGILYAQGGGEDRATLKKVALHIREDYYRGAEPSPNSSVEIYNVLREVENKLSRSKGCVDTRLENLL